MANYNSAYTGAQIDTCVGTYQNSSQVAAAINSAITAAKLAMFPIGSIYMSISNTNPSTFIGGTWERIQDTFLLAAGTTYTAGGTGGSTTHTLVENELPSHTHGLNNHTHTAGTYAASSVEDHTHGVQGFRSVASTSGGNPVVAYKKISGDAASTSTPVLSGGGHEHTISGTSGAASGNTEATGSGTAFSILPPYLTVYVWKRTA